MDTPEESVAFISTENAGLPAPPAPSSVDRVIDPDNPPWGLGLGILTWLSSIFFLIVTASLILLFYAAKRGLTPNIQDYGKVLTEFALKDKTAVFLQLLATLPAHLLTLVAVWAVVTKFGKRAFWETLGWSWGRYFNLWSSIAVGVILFFASSALAKLLGGDTPTQLEQMLNSSAAARYTIVFLATFTAPFVEELVYRGVLYSGLRKLIGTVGAVILVIGLFTLVHVPQYQTNLGVVAAVALLSLVLTIIRAVSGKLLPCFVVHLVFNGIQSVLILVSGSSSSAPPPVSPEHGAALIMTFGRYLSTLI